MFCTKCGAQNSDASVRCEKCGEVLPAPVVAQAGEESNNAAANMPPVNNYLVPAILSTVCCCQPFGIVSIIYASQVTKKINEGNYQGAVESSKKAKFWFILAIVLGLIGNVVGIIIYIMFVVANNNN